MMLGLDPLYVFIGFVIGLFIGWIRSDEGRKS